MNLPNALSLFRLFLVPVFLCVFFSTLPHAYLLAAGVFLLAGLTDILDGRLARKYNQVTMLGRILDPLADKMMSLSVLTGMAMRHLIPAAVTIIYIAREVFQMAGGALLFRYLKDMPPSNKWGKAATALLYVAILATILLDLPQIVKYFLFGCALGAMLIALLSYIVMGVRLLKENKTV
ncbi:MAG: CDP-diacylglycerol--glycerol-3-phosphate 3-phosphatidyltransferase [Ruminococcaceae bacterium]|jgi:cardiolipin synthase|nr:CDP-diacylglycerol--glycerol-3-phosphate 3-phosphatidyltransferase [Oscillospiraceae bacterium]